MYVGTGTGNLHIYQAEVDEHGKQDVKLVTRKNLGRKAIEQVGYIKDINAVVALSGMFLLESHMECSSIVLHRLDCNSVSFT